MTTTGHPSAQTSPIVRLKFLFGNRSRLSNEFRVAINLTPQSSHVLEAILSESMESFRHASAEEITFLDTSTQCIQNFPKSRPLSDPSPTGRARSKIANPVAL